MTTERKSSKPLQKKGPVSGPAQVIAELIFDSFREPSPAGTRSGSSKVRYMLYRTNSLVVELRFEFAAETDAARFSLAGQVMSSEEGTSQFDKVPIDLRSGHKQLAQTLTNPFGEFSLEYEAFRNVEIHVNVSQQEDVCIPLDDTFWKVCSAGL